MDNETVLVRKDGRVCTIILNRPEKRNSLTPDMLIKIRAHLDKLAEEDQVRAVVIRGVGDKAFCAGYDITALPTANIQKDNSEAKEENHFEAAMESIQNFPYPVIAMLNGYAFGGGCDLAVTCDMRIGAADIKMGMVPARLGVVYFPSGLKRFINVIGLSATREMFFTGQTYNSDSLKEIGMVNYIVPKDDLESFTYNIASTIATNAPLSLKGTKRIINLLLKSESMAADDTAECERLIMEAFASDDLKEGQLAFLEKRSPNFKGC